MPQLTERQAAERAQAEGQLAGLGLQRAEVQSQLRDLRSRRNQLDEQRQVAAQSERPGLEARIAELDARAERLDRQLLSLNDQISAALARRTAVTSGEGGAVARPAPGVIQIPQISIPPMDFGGRSRRTEMRDVAGFMAVEAVTLALIGVVAWRFAMKRMHDQFQRMFAAQAQQLTQLQQAMDVASVEMERISEGQRYVAKVLADGAPASALPGGRKQV
jgi:uncharacterized phage infection (PIP) family protein YhgE